ncbi:hypothetical protein FSP39_018276 [Pinctada imbricata]|uniref:Uncharacterized protein n=1 Tax=Pinctada imbricata TaxID=66713 RepID=A0AA88YK57_PINIB|nr:hypothetical protein FSP39_018276 [Pinctada imbricata]
MIWENGSSKIVMLANLVELGKNKCEQYWPNEKQEKINVGTYDIIMQNEKLYGAYNVRELLLKYKETREQRKVVQFHFTTWPDHGTADAIQLAIFQHVIDCEATQSTGPMVVHCSAGIGRTGTYIALDAMTKWIRNHSKVDVYSFVSSMRNNRMNMIQTSMKANVGMIATQYPTADTVQDFYSLIYDHDSPTIVILEPNEEVRDCAENLLIISFLFQMVTTMTCYVIFNKMAK